MSVNTVAAADLRSAATDAVDGRRRVVVEGVSPQLDGGRFPVKRIVGDLVRAEADAFTDGHDSVTVVLRWRADDEGTWRETEMQPLGNDRWAGSFAVERVGRYLYTVEAWADRFRTWTRDLRKRVEAAQDVSLDLLVGAELAEAAAGRAAGSGAEEDARRLRAAASALRDSTDSLARSRFAVGPELGALVDRHPDRRFATAWEPALEVVADPERGRFSAWYELFPRSASPDPTRHGTFRDVVGRLDYVAGMGFDVLYLPPIHPIGRQFRKGPNNTLVAAPGDPGVPWAIGGPEGGHTAIHPELGTPQDFRALVSEARARGIQVALDVAFQASPDHPWVREHPEWFRRRPDGTIQYAENPPKKYQDIYPFDFETADWWAMWQALREVFVHWVREGVTIFRVDNPHTKAFPFWEWCINSVKKDHPEVLFLSEAFTRPKVMYRLAKLGFSQSYTYFTWRNTKAELTEYFTELTRTQVSEFFRPNLWPNTPDILHEYLQHGGRPAFQARLVLAGTLGASYGIYGPAFELCENVPREPGSEEYLHSEKYQQRTWDLERPDSLSALIARVNRARRDHPALQSNERLAFHPVADDQLTAYSKRTEDRSDVVLAVVNLDPYRAHAGVVDLDLGELGVAPDAPFEVVDLLTDATYLWQGERNWVALDPASLAAHLFHVRPRLRSEQQFEYYL